MGLASDFHIDFGATGTIWGFNSGIQLVGVRGQVFNQGSIIGETGTGLPFNNAYPVLTNHGLIHGAVSGVSTTSSGEIYNFGIISENVGIETYNGNSTGAVIIENHGTIHGQGGFAINTTGNYDQYIENFGTIIGNVRFSVGDDRFVYNGGSVSGEITGLGGDDTLEIVNVEAGQAIDFSGSSGSDGVDVSGFGSAVWIDLEYTGIEVWTRDSNAVASGTWRAIADVASVENLTGTMGVDVLRGNASDNTFTYVGEQGISGQDRYDGRDGNDTVSFDGFTAAIWIDLSYTGSHLWTRDSDDLSSGDWRGIASTFNFENVIGTRHDDELRGDDNANVLTGGRGDDLLVGGVDLIPLCLAA